ncbi:acetyl-CoA carboxylase biotin carboxyl carrier protein [uncultured Parvimonas sp.]|jgi:acetyl-coA carboxylase, biotin carboxyl carrier protein|uniref:acetyl-CoA carboxylase biotin carboxyl carrier protein n=1 Tax=Parvimonas sp. G1604 TaxID=3388845 RepID=UPI001CB35B65|nr:acetyl-CoA carboxylase biotin carboxyl carrier protein [uncultured Parvimonas sp.]MBF1036506.1 acetyl-CoA carboxylase biotin carboxyl carrier protein [Parvimonas sp.]
MDIEKINSIVELFKNSGLDEMTLELKDFKINLKNNKVEYVAKEFVNVVEKSSPVKVEKVEEQVNDIKGEWIKAPFVGTFYAAPSANEAPYVKVGQKINKGDVICILEAMKVMNEIKSNKSGTVLEIKAQNGNMVEFDEELILIGD